MSSEVLSVPEEHLAEVIIVIREGLYRCSVKPAVRRTLEKWCKEETKYVKKLNNP